MTDQNNAAQAAEQEINAIMEQAQVFASAWSFLGGPFDNGSGLETAERERAALRTMLSKLRAEGVQAGDTLTQVYDAFGIGVLARSPSTLLACLGNVIRRANCLSQVEQVLSVPTPPEPEDDGVWGEESLLRWGEDEKGYAEHFKAAMAEWSRRAALASAPVSGTWTTGDDDLDMALNMAGVPGDAAIAQMEAVERLKARLASAPVAGEAHMPPGYRVKAVDGHGYRITPPTGSDWVAHSDTPAGDLVAALLAAPQASEAARIVFPAHLRKMWSGGEVQAWLDEHQGITPPKASAKGSLERYRAWQAEQADAKKDGAPCSCPSGDGSLRHPCAVHPAQGAEGGAVNG
ncbi:hypothetical protein [Achromobacter spanius]|uniref:hypothetical protein n=1 Tax=Achromobacter spanius TaxID=217203 RepID=UPI00320A6194